MKKKIENVGKSINIDKDIKVINAKNCYVMPGLIDAHSHLGVFDETMGSFLNDGNEFADPVTPHIRGIDAFNHFDPALNEVARNGITTVQTGPGSANPIGGQMFITKTLIKNNPEDMIIKEPSGLKMALGENPIHCYGMSKKFPTTRMGTASLIRENLLKGQLYLEKLKNSDKEKLPDRDLKSEILSKVISKELTGRIHCHRANDILTAIRISEEFNINISIEHCTEGHKIVDILANKNIPCVVGPHFLARYKRELSNLTMKNPGILSNAGVKVAIQMDTLSDTKYLMVVVALAVREGMNELDALKAVTINPAEILGIGDRVGSIKKGKDADIVIYDKHPFDFMAKPKTIFINGEII